MALITKGFLETEMKKNLCWGLILVFVVFAEIIGGAPETEMILIREICT